MTNKLVITILLPETKYISIGNILDYAITTGHPIMLQKYEGESVNSSQMDIKLKT
jgi:hypothetical protein